MIVIIDKLEQNEEKLGNKGKFLLQMKKSKFNVPGGFVLDSDTYDEVLKYNKIEDELTKILKSINKNNIKDISNKVNKLFDKIEFPKKLLEEINTLSFDNQKYAVRSSGTKEDLDNYSFAGQYESFLNIDKKDLKEKIVACYKSMFKEVILSYLVNNNISLDNLKMSVVVQEMVNSEYSGICFTINPTTGNDKEMLIEVSKGLGENIVSGKTRPEQYNYNWYDNTYSYNNKNKIISKKKLEEYAKTFLDVQLFFGYPCDIEFAIYKGKLYILQARKITRIKYSSIKDVWSTADFKDGGVSATVCTPYMWSLYEYIWEFTLRKFIIDSKILTDKEMPPKVGDMYYGRPYWNLSTVKKAMSKVVGYKEREFDSEYGIKINYDGDGNTTKITPKSLIKILKIALAQSKILKTRKDNAQNYKDDLLQKYYNYKENYDKKKIKDIKKDWYQITKKSYLQSEATYFWQIFINTIHQSLYKDSLLKYVSESEYLLLLGSIDNISHLLPFYEMWEVSRSIRKDKSSLSYWQKTSTEELKNNLKSNKNYLDKVNSIIDTYGYHSDKELDVTYPCYYEEKETMIQMIKDMLVLEDKFSPLEDKKNGTQAYQKMLDKIGKITSPSKHKKIVRKVEEMRNMLWWREEFRDVSTRFYYLIRIYTIELAKELKKEKVIKKLDDIWFLKVSNLWDYLDGKLKNKDLETIIDKNRIYYDSYRNYMSENEIGTIFDESDNTIRISDNLIKGLGANNGSVTGTARVIEDFSQIDRLEKDDILITKFTDTGWTPKFAILSGIVTEYGGILCHAAIVSREYGIPAIVCCHDAMKKIKDGQKITINGTTGVVTIEEE